MTVSAETMDQVAALTREILEERFGDDFVFDPILVIPRIDQYGDEYLEIKVVYDGDARKLDLGWTAGLGWRMWDDVEKTGAPGKPTYGFVEKSDWKAGPPK